VINVDREVKNDIYIFFLRLDYFKSLGKIWDLKT